jgi:hypothetical protein
MSIVVLMTSVIVLLAGVILRIWPRLKWPVLLLHDAPFHYAYIDLIRRHGFHVPKSDSRFLILGRGDYPAGYHYVLARLGPAITHWIDRFGGALYAFIAATFMVGALYRYEFIDLELAPALVGLYMIFPNNLSERGAPRGYDLTVRDVAEFLFAAIIGALLFFYPTPGPGSEITLFLFLSIATAAILLSSRFGSQNLAFITLFLWALSSDPLPLFVLFAGSLLALVVSRGFFLTQLKGHLYFIACLAQAYHDNKSYSFSKVRNARQNIQGILFDILRQPLLVVALYLGMSSPDLDVSQDIAMLFCVAAIFPWLGTSIGVTRVLGSAGRYLDHAFPAQWFLFWSLLGRQDQLVAAVVIFIGAVAIYVTSLRREAGKGAFLNLQGQRAAAEVIDREPEAVLLCLNFKDVHPLYLLSKARIVASIQIISPVDQDPAFRAKLSSQYPCVNAASLEWLVDEYGVRFILARKEDLNRKPKDQKTDFDLSPYKLIDENDRYSLYEVPGSASTVRSA